MKVVLILKQVTKITSNANLYENKMAETASDVPLVAKCLPTDLNYFRIIDGVTDTDFNCRGISYGVTDTDLPLLIP